MVDRDAQVPLDRLAALQQFLKHVRVCCQRQPPLNKRIAAAAAAPWTLLQLRLLYQQAAADTDRLLKKKKNMVHKLRSLAGLALRHQYRMHNLQFYIFHMHSCCMCDISLGKKLVELPTHNCCTFVVLFN